VIANGGTAIAGDRDFARVRVAAHGAYGAGAAGVRWLCADVTCLPWSDGSFAAAIAGEVLEHVADDARAARELCRVLRPGGRLIVTVPAGPRRFSPADAAAGHVRRYDRAGLGRLLVDAGLVDVTVRGWGWPFGRAYDRLCQRPALRARTTPLGRPVARLAHARIVAGLWRALFAVDDRRDAGDRGSGLLAVARHDGP
jgi:SAM-dependent methyltransferase